MTTAKEYSSFFVETELIAGDDDRLKIYGYRVNICKQLLTWLFIVITIGLLRLVFFWKPEWMLYCTHCRSSLETADSCLLIDKYGQKFVESIYVHEAGKGKNDDHVILYPRPNGRFDHVKSIRCLENRKTKYFWNIDEQRFEKLIGFDYGTINCGRLFEQQSGLNDDEHKQRLDLYGSNVIEIRIESVLKILFTEVLNPFYIYQFFTIGFWMADEYYYYASYILFMSFISLSLTTYQIRVNQRRLKEKMYGISMVTVYRNGQKVTTDSSQLVPGDVILLNQQSGTMFPCDSVLLSGEVIVNESMLTGESNPVTKTPIRDDKNHLFNHTKDSKHILYCGTSVIQIRQLDNELPRAIVIRTNFQSFKGELVKTILFPKPIDFKFSRHINHFLIAMSIIALSGFIYTVTMKIRQNDSIDEILFKAIDLITIVVPPELPAALTIATIFVDKRLRGRKIFCMSPKAINISGCVDCVCFDKTGTLTEDSVDLHEIVHSSNGKFMEPIKDSTMLDTNDTLLRSLAVCHSIKLLDNSFIGDDLEIKLFNWTGWQLMEPNETISTYGYTIPAFVMIDDQNVAILKQFPFTSSAARMSVIVSNMKQNVVGDEFEFFIKGAPETIIPLCHPKTVPSDFTIKLNEYTRKSYRVLAVAHKQFSKITNEELESRTMESYENDLTFLGLIIVRNMLKESTIEAIDSLNRANIRLVMITGDNIMTALSVGQECGIIKNGDDVAVLEMASHSTSKPTFQWSLYKETSENSINYKTNDYPIEMNSGLNENYKLAITGPAFKLFREHYPELIPQFMVRGTIFARMAPEQKQQLVEMLQSVGYYVAMCGDGANDASALKIAHCGISLADTEASVASAFTSLTGQISCVVDLLREGRASLVSVFGIVRYMACYNIVTFLAICILYYYHSALTDIQNLYQDVAIISVYIFMFGRSHPHDTLSPIRPPTSLIGISQFSSIILQLSLVAIFQFGTLNYLHSFPWYKSHNITGDFHEDDSEYKCHDNYAMFFIQIFQYITLVIVFSKGIPYRRPFYKNRWLTLAIVITTIVTTFILVTPETPIPWIGNFFELDTNNIPQSFRWSLIAFSIIHFVIALLLEKYIVEHFIVKLSRKYKKRKCDQLYDQSRSIEWLPIKIR